MPGVPAPVTKPCEAVLTPKPPCGSPMLFALRTMPRWNSLTVDVPKTRVFPSVINCARPIVRASKPGNAGAALLARIGVIQPIVIEEIVDGELPPAGVRIDAARSLIISDRLRRAEVEN